MIMDDVRQKAREEIQAMRDEGMTEAQIRRFIYHRTVNSEIIMELKESRHGGMTTTMRKLHKLRVSRDWLRRQLLAVPGNTPRFVDKLLDKIKAWGGETGDGCYADYWYLNRYGILAAQITERRRQFFKWLMEDDDE